eukprot:COSAG02_NODE_71633_length_190_cov_31.175824_1_plen_33_part_01
MEEVLRLLSKGGDAQRGRECWLCWENTLGLCCG